MELFSSHKPVEIKHLFAELKRESLFLNTTRLTRASDEQFSVFTSHVIKTKNHNHSMNKVKNLGYDR